MASNKTQKEKDESDLRFSISGAGVITVSSSDILKSKRARRQIEALGELKRKKILGNF